MVGKARHRAASGAWSRDPSLDPEKAVHGSTYASSTNGDTPPYSESPRRSPSIQPTSQPSQPRRRRGKAPFMVPHRVMRLLCLALLFALVLFILTLFRFSLISPSRAIPLDLNPLPPKPPKWESFPFLKRFYGGLRTLVPRSANVPEYTGEGSEEPFTEEKNELDARAEEVRSQPVSSPYDPYPDYKTAEYIQKYGEKVDCFLDEEGTVRIPPVHYYEGIPRGFPDPPIGSNEVVGIQNDICFDRFGRLAPYGLGYSPKKGGIGAGLEGDREGVDRIWEKNPPVDFREVQWASAQNRCVAANLHRFKEAPEIRLDRALMMPVGVPRPLTVPSPPSSKKAPKTGSDRLPRTALLIRTWFDFHYTEEDILYLRSLISELTLLSGGEYTVHFLIHVKDDNLQIWADDATYERVLHDSLPEEFRGMGTLWSERQMGLVYGGLEETWMRDLPVHGVYRSTFMPVQYFAYLHPEYDYFWNWEMDARHTGHWYHFFDKVISWARKQPRKGLWERNARYYVPAVHGEWEEFKQTVRVQTELGTNSPNNLWAPLKAAASGDKATTELKDGSARHGEKFIWGPERPDESDVLEVEGEGIPPSTMDKDHYEWGVGEEADLIVFNPFFDPEGTTWLLRDDVTGYNKENGMPPRRTAIITASRLSRKLLLTMHKETSLKRHTMFSEMWPGTTALHHGFKAVSIPHSIYIDRRWPIKYLESVFNAGRNGATGGARTTIFGEREHNFRGTSWFYSAGFSPNLWRRWLGYRVDNNGGEQEEVAGEGRMCLPPMLLHPIKGVEMVIDDGGERDNDE